jgi:type IV secretory pathway TraG/TraD family ATPase VirD4
MLGLATESAYRATANPNFNPRDWVRRGGGAALFLVGNTQEQGMTRSLLATALHELLSEANEFAREYDDERLPHRLVILADELASLCPVPDLSFFFATARSTRIQILGVFQSYGQIEDVYGREIARVLFDASAPARSATRTISPTSK